MMRGILHTLYCVAFIIGTLLISGMAGNGCINRSEQLPTAAFAGVPHTGYAPLYVDFADRSQSGDSLITHWFWDFGDGFESTQRNPTHLFNQPGVYNVQLTVRNYYGSHELLRENYIIVHEPVLQYSRLIEPDINYYLPGETRTITLVLEPRVNMELRALGIQEQLPYGWEITQINESENLPDSFHIQDNSGILEMIWFQQPSLPLEITYQVKLPETIFGTQKITGEALFRGLEGELRSNTARTELIPNTTP